jgi:hypothetical protein
MIPLTIEWSGLDHVLNDIDLKLAAAQQVVVDDLKEFGAGARDEMVRTHTFQNRTFRLERSIDFDVVAFVPGQENARATVFALTEYASQVEFGVDGRSRPYPFFWPVWYKWLALLEEKLRDDWPRAFHG